MLAILGELILELDRRPPQSHICEFQPQILAKSLVASRQLHAIRNFIEIRSSMSSQLWFPSGD